MNDDEQRGALRLGEAVREARVIKHMSQTKLAAAAGVSLRTIQALEAGHVTPRVLPRIEEALGWVAGSARRMLDENVIIVPMANSMGIKFTKAPSSPSIGQRCPACGRPFKVGDHTTLVSLGPGRNRASQNFARAGQPYQSVASEVHWACATGERDNGNGNGNGD